MNPGDALKARRSAANLSQQELATRIGMSMQIVSRWETGGHHPSREAIEKVDQVLGAGGELLAAFGYAPIQPDALSELRGRVADLTEQVGELSARLAATGAEVAQLRGRKHRGEN